MRAGREGVTSGKSFDSTGEEKRGTHHGLFSSRHVLIIREGVYVDEERADNDDRGGE